MLAFDALLATARLVGQVFEGTATGGAADKTTLIDTAQLSTLDDFYNGGTMFFRSGTGLINKTAVITDYANTARTWTFAAQAAQITAGILYAVARPTYNRGALLAAVNLALAETGVVTQVDDTLTVTADTEEYALPSGVLNVARVEVASNDAEPYAWKMQRYWRENGGNLIFPDAKKPTTADMPIRLWYNAPAAAVQADSDTISDYIPLERLAWCAAVHAVEARLRLAGKDDPSLDTWLKTVGYPRRNEALLRYPLRNMARDPILAGYLA